MKKICVVYKAFLAAICCGVLVNGFEHDTFWGEKGLYGCYNYIHRIVERFILKPAF
jgi:hypothetical protein